MVRRKSIRTRGKIQLSRYFQKLKEGDTISIVLERTLRPKISKRLQGRTGVIESKRGNAYVVKINDLNKEKKYIIKPIHLKKLNDF